LAEAADAAPRLKEANMNNRTDRLNHSSGRVGQDSTRISELTQRETQCLDLVAEGKSSWSIGLILGISENTVNFHLKNACKKFNTNSRFVAVRKAINARLINP
jgi:LuxR family quorum-sensing system transcriptional regulator CciR